MTKPQLDQAVLIDGNISDEADKILAKKITILSPNSKTTARSNITNSNITTIISNGGESNGDGGVIGGNGGNIYIINFLKFN